MFKHACEYDGRLRTYPVTVTRDRDMRVNMMATLKNTNHTFHGYGSVSKHAWSLSQSLVVCRLREVQIPEYLARVYNAYRHSAPGLPEGHA